MMACCESKSKVLPYGHFLTRIFKKFGVALMGEKDIQMVYDTYNSKSMDMMHFDRLPDGLWVQKRIGQVPPPKVEEEDEI